MTVLLDTGVLSADHDTDATRHGAARAALDAVYDRAFGHPSVSDHVFDEAITLTRRRTGSHEAAMALCRRLRGEGDFPRVFELLHVSTAVFADALACFERYADQAPSFTDATSVALVERHGLDGGSPSTRTSTVSSSGSTPSRSEGRVASESV